MLHSHILLSAGQYMVSRKIKYVKSLAFYAKIPGRLPAGALDLPFSAFCLLHSAFPLYPPWLARH
jgi:hypothetical protein